jgi:type II secretory pathway pseudopilin PulG
MFRKGEKGFTLLEVTIILLVLVILGSILLPVAERYIDLARIARVREDVQMLASLVELYKVDMCDSGFRVDGDNPSVLGANRVDMLVGSIGDTPDWGTLASPNDFWKKSGPDASQFVDTIDNQLILGDPFGPAPDTHDPYPRGGSNPQVCGWRGPYMTGPVLQDPWGNRYMINVAFLAPYDSGIRTYSVGSSANWAKANVFVLSAGPDEIVETPFVNYTGAPTGDDQIALIKGTRPAFGTY